MSGAQAAVPAEDGKNQGRVGTTKVKRYRAGEAPEWAQEEEDEDEDLVVRKPEKISTSISAPVVVKTANDPRLARLAQSRSTRDNTEGARRRHGSDEDEEEDDDEEEIAARRRRLRQHQRREEEAEEELEKQDEPEDEPEEEDDEGGKGEAAPRGRTRQQAAQQRDDDSDDDDEGDEDDNDEDEEAIAMRRQMLKAKLQERQTEAAAAEPAAAGESEEESEEDSEYETDSSDEEGGRQMLKPVFVSKQDRETIKEKERLEAEAAAAVEQQRVRAEERKAETRDLVIETLRQEEEAANAQPEKATHEVNTDDEDEEAEFEAWKLRELNRIKRDRDAKEALEKEAAEKERLKNMTEEERRAWELANPKEQPQKEKQNWKFLQKYWHKGAYFQEATDGKDRTGIDEIFKRDFSGATGEDKMDRSALPQVMQVKNFGRSGRSKWTHLSAEDTTTLDQKPDYQLKRGPGTNPDDFSRPKKLRT